MCANCGAIIKNLQGSLTMCGKCVEKSRLSQRKYYSNNKRTPARKYRVNSIFTWPNTPFSEEELTLIIPSNTELVVDVFGGTGRETVLTKALGYNVIYNDIDLNLINTIRAIIYQQADFKKVQKDLQATTTIELIRLFNKINELDPLTAAVVFFMACKKSTRTPYFKINRERKTVHHLTGISILEQLRGVPILNKDFTEVIPNTDSKNTLFICDPPFIGTEYMFAGEMGERQERLATLLSNISGKFIVSGSSTRPTLKLFSAFPYLYWKASRMGAKTIIGSNYEINIYPILDRDRFLRPCPILDS